MRHFYSFLFSLLLTAFGVAAYAQSEFTTVGSASSSSPGVPNATCFQLTPALTEQAGAIWNNTPIDLSQSFILNTKLYFGALDAGADGLAFVLRASGTPNIGTGGGGLGYWGIGTSFVVEFDTWQNNEGCFSTGDPAGDHIGFMRDGNPFHVMGPAPCNFASGALQAPTEFPSNIEDNQWHDATFSWDATMHVFTVSIFGHDYSFTGDIVNTIFGGNSSVIWGFTAGTGAGSGIGNEHGVCFVTTPPPPPPPPPTCGQLRTQTPGGWGAPPHGNNPGAYLHAHFDDVFPNGLTVGSTFTLTLTSADAITNYIPAGGQPKALTKNYTDPQTKQLKNTLVDHIVALTLSVGFDMADPSFGEADIHLGDMIIGSGAFEGWTVSDFLAEANIVLGGGSSNYSVQQVLETAAAINENYVDGKTDKGFLDCPTTSTTQRMIQGRALAGRELSTDNFSVRPNPTRGQVELHLNNAQTGLAQVQITNTNGTVVERRAMPLNGKGQTLRFDLSKQAAGIYLIRIITKDGVQTQKIVVQK